MPSPLIGPNGRYTGLALELEMEVAAALEPTMQRLLVGGVPLRDIELVMAKGVHAMVDMAFRDMDRHRVHQAEGLSG
jgi:hypothetical protein